MHRSLSHRISSDNLMFFFFILFASQLFIADENTDVTEEDYQKALSLTPFVEDPLDIKHKIWCSAILRDTWDSYNVNAPLETVQHFMLYKFIDLCLILCKFYLQLSVIHISPNIYFYF